MPSLYAQVQTERASRYLVQFCKHAAAIGDGGHSPRVHLHTTLARRKVRVAADWSEASGTVTFTPWGRCTLTAEPDTLTLDIDAVDEDGLSQIREVIDRDLQRFSRREPLTVTWQRPDTAVPAASAVTSNARPGFRRPRPQVLLLVLAAALVIAGHVGLAGTVVARSRWTATAAGIVAALIAVKIALIGAAHLAARRRRSKSPSTPHEHRG